jgi:hypothetical protein
MTHLILQPHIPLCVLDTPADVCTQLAALREAEMQVWPRRNVRVVLRSQMTGPCLCGCDARQALVMSMN